MNKPITAVETLLALRENFIGPPTDADAGDRDVPGLKPAKRKKLITTIALTIDTCRWPVGDPVDSDFHYCGEPPLVGRPYCDKHDTQSYQAARKKKTAA
jgi:GcrA cell cycle regulator